MEAYLSFVLISFRAFNVVIKAKNVNKKKDFGESKERNPTKLRNILSFCQGGGLELSN
jgi:hypothetical protein